MVQELLNRFVKKPTPKTHVTSARTLKKAVKASMKDQRDLLETAQKIKSR